MNTALGSIAAAANDIARRTDAAAQQRIIQSTAGSRIRYASALLHTPPPGAAERALPDATQQCCSRSNLPVRKLSPRSKPGQRHHRRQVVSPRCRSVHDLDISDEASVALASVAVATTRRCVYP